MLEIQVTSPTPALSTAPLSDSNPLCQLFTVVKVWRCTRTSCCPCFFSFFFSPTFCWCFLAIPWDLTTNFAVQGQLRALLVFSVGFCQSMVENMSFRVSFVFLRVTALQHCFVICAGYMAMIEAAYATDNPQCLVPFLENHKWWVSVPKWSHCYNPGMILFQQQHMLKCFYLLYHSSLLTITTNHLFMSDI